MKFAEPRPIKDYCLGIYDGPHATPKEADDGPVFLGIKNITDDGTLDLSEIRHVSEEEYPRWTRRVTPQAGDVVFTYEATLHRYALIPEGFEDAWVGALHLCDLIRIRSIVGTCSTSSCRAAGGK